MTFNLDGSVFVAIAFVILFQLKRGIRGDYGDDPEYEALNFFAVTVISFIFVWLIIAHAWAMLKYANL